VGSEATRAGCGGGQREEPTKTRAALEARARRPKQTAWTPVEDRGNRGKELEARKMDRAAKTGKAPQEESRRQRVAKRTKKALTWANCQD